MGLYIAQELAEWTGGKWSGAIDPDEQLNGFCQDTRRLQSREVFVALRTAERDGHDFLAQAKESGAAAALVQETQSVDLPQLQVDDTLTAFHQIATQYRSAYRQPVVGITGSAGKTSTKDLLAQLLGREQTHATHSNFNNLIGVPLTLTAIDPSRHSHAVIEAGMNEPGEMEQLGAMIQADRVIITMIGPAHLEKLGSVEAIAKEKMQLANTAKTNVPVYFPAACLRYKYFRDLGTRARVICREGEEIPANPTDFHLLHYWTGMREDSHLSVQLQAGDEILFTGVVPPLSKGMMSNCILALWVALEMGVSKKELQERLESWSPSKLRGEVRRSGSCFYFIDCYNANPASMLDSLEAFTGLFGDSLPRMLVLGSISELGERSAKLHKAMAKSIHLRRQDRAIVVGDFSQEVAEGLLANGAKSEQVQTCENATQAKELMNGFEGAIFLKGSRKWELEKVLPENLYDMKGVGHAEPAC